MASEQTTRQLPIILALGTTQTLAWASSYYLPAILADPIGRDLGMSSNWIFAAFSAALVISALLGPRVGRQIDLFGGRPVLCTSNLTIAAGLVLLGIAALVVTAVASLLYLAQERELKAKKPRKFYYRLPALGTLDDLISKSMGIGFVLITLAVIAATTWASIYTDSSWIRDPKIVISFFTWGTYMVLVFLRTTAGWRGRKAAIMTVTVLGFSMITWAAHAGLGALLLRP